jgi:hypothetical protein
MMIDRGRDSASSSQPRRTVSASPAAAGQRLMSAAFAIVCASVTAAWCLLLVWGTNALIYELGTRHG